MPSLKDLLELMNSSWPVAMVLLLAGAAILVGHESSITAHYFVALPTWTAGAAFIAVAFGGSMLSVTALRFLIDWASGPFRRRRNAKWKKDQLASLSDLSEPEKILLAWAFANRTRVFSAPYFHPVTKALTAKGLLMIPGGNHHTDKTPFEIPQYLWDFLKEDLADDDLKQFVGIDLFRQEW
ncbi:hypothetical protein [Agrobacterium tumefaciens]|uniref:Uncharacterized protein n=1 Tax=Agrobacterium tumefaciens TaxID=358 RepID=A0AA44F8V3_AGRTU|nr:hypothetical protein [Agrobacterium tumefaciens]NSL21745.1 hypothetical protein [Agrobacterium tumefaciens]NTB85516.1 hypothetical protein [Agrobacterium tumefaciens]NTC18863.1 hypothetical protein [Agrobacterium tumefaciens]NTC30843.1 hypothetical protein [Agrobacterium tumefaciens]NTC55707.1 hypothetical protein [Agrobacterium tumefaciens]